MIKPAALKAKALAAGTNGDYLQQATYLRMLHDVLGPGNFRNFIKQEKLGLRKAYCLINIAEHFEM